MSTTIFDVAFGLFCRAQATISSLLIYGLIVKDEDVAAFIVFSAILADIIRFLLRNRLVSSIVVGGSAVALGFYVVTGVLSADIGKVNILPSQNISNRLNTMSPFLYALEGAGGADILLRISAGFSLIQNGIFILFSHENSQLLHKKRVKRDKMLPFTTVFCIFLLQIFFLFISAAPIHAGIFNIHVTQGAEIYIESVKGRLLLIFPFIFSSVGVFLAAGFSWIGLNSWKVARQLSRERQG